jgi:hypothetical protein
MWLGVALSVRVPFGHGRLRQGLGPPRAQVGSRPQGRPILGPIGPAIRQNAKAGIRPLEAGRDKVAGIRLNRPQHEDLIPKAVDVGGRPFQNVAKHNVCVGGVCNRNEVVGAAELVQSRGGDVRHGAVLTQFSGFWAFTIEQA